MTRETEAAAAFGFDFFCRPALGPDARLLEVREPNIAQATIRTAKVSLRGLAGDETMDRRREVWARFFLPGDELREFIVTSVGRF